MKTSLLILHLEDDPNDSELVEAMLNAGGIACHLVRVQTRPDFISALEQGGFDLILADHSLPSFDGISALEIALEKSSDVPFIFVSGTLGEELAIETLKSGATDYVLKQRLSRLVPSVRRALREASERSARKRAEEELRDSENKFRELFHNANDAIFLNELAEGGELGLFVEVNDIACRRLGYSRQELLAMRPADIIDPARLGEMPRSMRELLAQGQTTFETTYLSKRGLKIPVEVSARVFILRRRKVILSIARDVTERKQAEEKINFLAYYDALTNLPNRTLFENRLSHALALVQRGEKMLAVIFLDLNSFKTIDETLGYAAGDQLLQLVAERLTGCVRKADTLARFGGDEFALLAQISRAEEASRIAQKMLEAFSSQFSVAGQELYITASMGIALYPFDGENIEALLKNAQSALERAKAHGRNNYQFYTADMHARALERLTLENGLRRALDRNEFVLYYQPQVDLDSGEIVGVEALLRWLHPERGLVLPGEFIPLAEDAGLIVPIGKRTLRAACAQNKAWQNAGLTSIWIPVSVNLSPRQFREVDLVEMIDEALEETGLDASHLELELTESSIMDNAEHAIDTLHKLKEMGIRISIDDFGTGYSSLSNLKRLPIDKLKIPPSFVSDVTTDSDTAAIVMTIITLAHKLRLKVVAEGVETEKQLSFLRSVGCDQIQGNLFSSPMPGEAFRLLWLKRLENEQLRIGPVKVDLPCEERSESGRAIRRWGKS